MYIISSTFLSSFTAIISNMFFFFTLMTTLIMFFLRADTNGAVYITTTAT